MPRIATLTSSKRRPRENDEQSSLSSPARASFNPHSHVLSLQRSAGNRAVSELLQSGTGLGAWSLRISQPDDSSEREAESVAARVSAFPVRPLLQRNAAHGAFTAAGGATSAGILNNLGSGQPLDPATRDSMESRFGTDFSPVRVHTGVEATKVARGVDARAFTVGRDVVFADGEYAPQTNEGQRLLAHELTHVVQQREQTIARAVSADYPTIKHNLTYRFNDWAITDKEAHDVLVILNGLNPVDFADTLQAMEKDDLVSPLLENISGKDNSAFAPLIKKIHSQRSTGAIAKHIEDLLSYRVVLDWVITDEDAHLVLETLKSLKADPKKLRDVVVAIPGKQYERFYDNLSDKDQSENLRFLQDLEMMRSSGMTLEELTATQKKHLETQAAAEGKSVGEYIKGEAAKRGYGGTTPTWWSSLTKTKQDERKKKFAEVVAKIRADAPKELKAVINAAEAAGGGIEFNPDKAEELGAFGVNIKDKLIVGKKWLETAEHKIEDVYDNISHELGGHREYGATASWDIMKGVLAALTAAERTTASSGKKKPYTAYGYMETEIYAELREYPYQTEGSRSDNPVDDVENQLEKIKLAFEWTVAVAIVRGFRRRVQLDSKVSSKSRELLDDKIKVVFGITF
jgi:hypothetical protein